MISTHEGRSYSTRPTMIDGKRRVDFVLTCAGCGADAAIHMDPQCAPDIIVRKFTRLGWLANDRNAKGCYCPTCLGKKAKEKPEMPTTGAELPRGPTHDQLKRIAAQLREVFNSEHGYYFDSLSDHKVADKLSVPWSWVRQVRELLGYEIKIDPEIKGLRDELAALADMVMTLETKLNRLEKERVA